MNVGTVNTITRIHTHANIHGTILILTHNVFCHTHIHTQKHTHTHMTSYLFTPFAGTQSTHTTHTTHHCFFQIWARHKPTKPRHKLSGCIDVCVCMRECLCVCVMCLFVFSNTHTRTRIFVVIIVYA